MVGSYSPPFPWTAPAAGAMLGCSASAITPFFRLDVLSRGGDDWEAVSPCRLDVRSGGRR
jgi:hypothetical protein